MEITKYSKRIQSFLKQEYGSEEEVKKALNLFKEEGESIAVTLGLEVAPEHDTLLELYAEHRIYSAMGNEKLATLKLEVFNKLLKSFVSVAENKKKLEEIKKSQKKGMMIFNE